MKAKRQVVAEVDVADGIVRWLEENGWTCFHEVKTPYSDGRADIVAKCDRGTWVIETKVALTVEVLAQAWRWRRNANWVSVGVRAQRRSSESVAHEMLREVAERRGIGILETKDLRWDSTIQEVDEPKILPAQHNPHPHDWFSEALREEHRTHAKAGTNRGGYVTEFKLTSERLEAFVREHPGVSLKDAARLVENHYSSRWAFMAAVRKLAGKVIRGIEVREVHGVDCLFPVEQEVA
jgi:hypothetical protein